MYIKTLETKKKSHAPRQLGTKKRHFTILQMNPLKFQPISTPETNCTVCQRNFLQDRKYSMRNSFSFLFNTNSTTQAIEKSKCYFIVLCRHKYVFSYASG